VANVSIAGLLEQRKRVFYGWWIATAGAIQDAIKGGTFNEGFLFYFLPITRDFGIARAATSLPFSLGKLEGAFEGPLIGYLIDRFGARVMVAAGGLIAGLGFILLSFTHNYLFFLIVFVGVLSLGFKAGFNHAMMAAINHRLYISAGLRRKYK
jgi:MFS family permease